MNVSNKKIKIKKNNYSWNNEGKLIITKDKIKLTQSEYNIIYELLKNPIPYEMRKDYWLIITQTREKINSNKNYYKTVLTLFQNYIKNEHPIYLQLQKKIEIDINRSFINKTGEIEKNNLRNVLSAFTIRNITINYCQGFNQIVVRLLEITEFNEEESFWLFCSIIEDILPYEFYLTGVGIESDMELINNIIKKNKNLNNFFENNNSEYLINSCCAKWLISLFISGINNELSNIILDIIFFFRGYNNIINLYNAIITMFSFIEKSMINEVGLQIVNEKIINLGKNDLENINEKKNLIIFNLLIFDKRIKYNDLKINKERNKIINEKMKIKPLLGEVEVKKEINCLDKYPICVKDINYKNDIKDYMILSTKNKLNNIEIIDDYFLNENNLKNNIKNNKNMNINNNENNNDLLNEDDILIERKNHLCGINIYDFK